jgi:hypothetical protein
MHIINFLQAGGGGMHPLHPPPLVSVADCVHVDVLTVTLSMAQTKAG